MGKNIVVCCDGTSNEFSTKNTNVIKLYMTLVNDPARQVTYYHPGLGTMAPPGALTDLSKGFWKGVGLAMGAGLENDIRDAYAFLMEVFEEGDQVYLFGFSRGAYTARSLAALLRMCGLIGRGNEPIVPYAIQLMEQLHAADHKGGSAVHEVFDLAEKFKATFSRHCEPHFVGVWDTVSSVGWFVRPLSLPYTASNPDIAIGRHAVAIDERRGFFPSNLWWPKPDGGPKDLKQVWFPGSHSDVGGGYPEPECGQSKYALEWMLVEAEAKGLLIKNDVAHLVLGRLGQGFVPPSVAQPVHESLTFGWWLTEIAWKPHYDRKTGAHTHRMNLGRRREIPPGSLIHQSAYLRGNQYTSLRLPPGAVMEPVIPYP